MRSLLHALLLAATLASPFILAKPIPMSDDDIQRRWSQGDSEVCCSPNAPGCYVLAWVRSLAGSKPRTAATIHAASTYRDATPAWPVLGRGSEAETDNMAFTYATDERTMALHNYKRETPMSPSLLAQMKSFVHRWYKAKGRIVNVGNMEKEHNAKMAAKLAEREEAPVLQPARRGMVYRLTS